MINLYYKDCMEAMADMEDNAYDLAIVDPPYGIQRFQKPVESKECPSFSNKMSQWDIKPPKEYFTELLRVSKNQIIWGANNFNLPSTEYFCIWDKCQAMDNFASAEYAWVSMGLKTPSKIFKMSIALHNQTKKIHPTQKPVELYQWILDNYAKPGDKILDTHLGSGSIAIACHNSGFYLDAYEIDFEYFHAAKNRLWNHQKQLQLFGGLNG